MDRLSSVVLCFALGMLAVGCALRPDREVLIGTYQAAYPFGRQELILRPDGTYSQQVWIDGVQGSSSNSAKWRYDDKTRMLVYENCLVVSDIHGLRKDFNTPQRGNCMAPAGRQYVFWGPMSLGTAEGTLFIKQ